MPSSGDTKTVTTMMYQAGIKKMRNAAEDAVDATNEFIGITSVCAAFVAFAKSPLAVATAILLEVLNYGNGKIAQYNADLQDAYEDALDAMLGSYPVIYYDVAQNFKYVVHGSDGGWIQTGMPTFTRHYTDY
ncbi:MULTISPECIES: hypothetical protein [unclassified Sedimentibacter]|uniref:hypothetical protein n=1 Tax=unclassified Sedimentibacter TaxID=2649220 RepID=UPI0027E0ADCA|nr:hypothetical protein [Sedimentibacter sp. MB35-C1]WMJ77675.1 hypothetical protein RBQ61_01750 [Sedimentibacter sp. MB35-C1]